MTSITDARVFLIMMGARKVGNALYAWGGETETEGGYDCSGFVSHILTETNRAWPGTYTGGRQTAKNIYRYYDELGCPDISKVKDLAPGCVVFYFSKGKTKVPEKGPIQLQTHGGEIRWRNVFLREIPADEAKTILAK